MFALSVKNALNVKYNHTLYLLASDMSEYWLGSGNGIGYTIAASVATQFETRKDAELHASLIKCYLGERQTIEVVETSKAQVDQPTLEHYLKGLNKELEKTEKYSKPHSKLNRLIKRIEVFQ